ncbi:MAG: hypothetical protein L0H26_04760, partial [Microlunatus sp.]|nr:hypothetical protein [Microlunatus sp.]
RRAADSSTGSSSADQEPTMATHLDLDALADLVVGELSSEGRAAAETHLVGCAACREHLAQVTADLGPVRAELGLLREVPAAPMPVTVAARLDRVLAAETGAAAPDRSSREPSSSASGPAPLKAPVTASYVRQTRAVRLMLVAAVAAAVVGFGGYVVSATAGLNEPAAVSPAQVEPAALAEQAKTLAESRELDPHLFSSAWRCARKVTAGRITGITPVYVDGVQSYLVYTRTSGRSYATVVSGCDEGEPTAGHRVALTE